MTEELNKEIKDIISDLNQINKKIDEIMVMISNNEKEHIIETIFGSINKLDK